MCKGNLSTGEGLGAIQSVLCEKTEFFLPKKSKLVEPYGSLFALKTQRAHQVGREKQNPLTRMPEGYAVKTNIDQLFSVAGNFDQCSHRESKRFPRTTGIMVTLSTQIETEKKQSFVKSDDSGSTWTRRDVLLDHLQKRGIPLQGILENVAFFQFYPHLVPSMLKILNPCYDCEGFFNPKNSYYSNKSLSEKEQMIGSVTVQSCSARTIKRHKALLQQGRQLTLVERHSFKERLPTLHNTDTRNSLDHVRTTICIPSSFYAHFTSAVDWHRTMRECSELFDEEVSNIISYKHFEEISFDIIVNNKFRVPYGGPRYTNTLLSSSNEEGTYEGTLFYRAKRKKNGELRKPRKSRLLFTPARHGSLGIADNPKKAFEGTRVNKPVVFPGDTYCQIQQPPDKSPETPPVGQNAVDVGQTIAKEKQASTGSSKQSIQKQKKPRLISKQETKPLKLSQMPDARTKIGKKAYDWAVGMRISEGGALVRLQGFGKQQQLALDGGKLSAKDALTCDVIDYWLTKVSPVQLMYVLDESSAFIKKNKVYSRVRFLEYRICSAIKNITAYEQRKNFNKSATTTSLYQGQK